MEINENNKQEEIKEISKSNQKRKFVPSYQNKENQNISVNRTNSYKNDLKKRRKSIIWIIILVIILVLLGIGVYKLVDYFKYKKYESYNEKMKIYGFERMYDNCKCTVEDKVTKSESIKMIVSSVLNIYNIENLENASYDNEIWVSYAKEREWLTTDINNDNYNDKATLMECLNILSRIKTAYLSKNLDVDKIPNYSDFEHYSNDEQVIIKDMFYNGILDDDVSKLNANKDIRKGQLNSIIIKFVEKYNLITVDEEKLNINNEKLPYNAEVYPYILASVNKEIYQKRFYYVDEAKAILPIDFYADNKEQYISIKYLVQNYLETILNIDYTTINKDEFKDRISESLYYMPSDDYIDKYIEYVKTNRISTIGNFQVIYPIIYFDGENIRARVYVSYLINNSDTYENIFFGDLEKSGNYIYNNEDNLYLDMTFTKLKDDGPIKIVLSSLKDWSIGNIKKAK